MNQNRLSEQEQSYVIGTRRSLHQIPECAFDLPETTQFIQDQLESMGISCTTAYGKSSVVGYLGPEDAPLVIGLRADEDALPVLEETGLPFSSVHPGKMHACGHDGHMAMALGTARYFTDHPEELKCRIKFMFQPSEECSVSGAEMMVKNGVLDDVDFVIAQHMDPLTDCGTISVTPGPAMAACMVIALVFIGNSTHASEPQQGADALAMAVKTYTDIEIMLVRQLAPSAVYICNIGELHGGTAHNVVPGRAEMKISLRTFQDDLRDNILGKIRQIAQNNAEEMGGEVNISANTSAYTVVNDIDLTEKLICSAKAVLGDDKVFRIPPRLNSEDYAWFTHTKPSVMFWNGTRNISKSVPRALHDCHFIIDEDSLCKGTEVLIQFILDQQKSE